jgi:hypothetical protein
MKRFRRVLVSFRMLLLDETTFVLLTLLLLVLLLIESVSSKEFEKNTVKNAVLS